LATVQPFSTDACTRLGELLLELGDGTATEVVTRAAELADDVEYDPTFERQERAIALLVRAQLYAKATQFLSGKGARCICMVLRQLGELSISTHWLRALSELLKVHNNEVDYWTNKAVSELALALARRGDAEGEKLFLKITDPREPRETDFGRFGWLAEAAWQAGHRNVSCVLARLMEGEDRIELLLALTRNFRQTGDH
jgi:hypothetical protein